MKVFLVAHTCEMQTEYPLCVAKTKEIAVREYEKWKTKEGRKAVEAWGWKMLLSPIEYVDK
jgi:hypothetical protein